MPLRLSLLTAVTKPSFTDLKTRVAHKFYCTQTSIKIYSGQVQDKSILSFN